MIRYHLKRIFRSQIFWRHLIDDDKKIRRIYIDSKSPVNSLKKWLQKKGWVYWKDKDVLFHKEVILDGWTVEIYICHVQLVSPLEILKELLLIPYNHQIAIEIQRRLDKK